MTQSGCAIKNVQSDNGCGFNNTFARTFFLDHSALLRMSCTYMSSQNGKAKPMIRSATNVIHSMLFQASLPASY